MSENHVYAIIESTSPALAQFHCVHWAGGPERNQSHYWIENAADRIEEIRSLPGVILANPTDEEPS